MKFVMIAVISLMLASCASHHEQRTPASQQTVDEGINAESYNMNR
ncbi:hypothetical protein [Peredibacter starrii]|uniref:Lipoprotein n=1 Tax=Peredibacter starrii TaxID=28202 RepID=A0AAX4HTF6_9BACT|nr:hypothetical protein [Peredibacter starrii]WPU66470.1 hypothetical protein SOO65_06895 [Peredibacter starrii]